MHKVLIGLQRIELFVYFDDMVIHAKNLEEHGMKVNSFSIPLNPKPLKKIKQFLGLARYYRRFIEDFSAIPKIYNYALINVSGKYLCKQA